MHLYRAISLKEHQDIIENGFRAGPNSLAGKWFADYRDHAYQWEKHLVIKINFRSLRLIIQMIK
ncbi:MAG: hypothetical protein AAF433_11665 [Bacteroidota bacterium]